MKDRQIGTRFEYPGVGMLEVCSERAVNECFGCVFDGREHCGNDPDKIHSGCCALSERSDATGVIFVKTTGEQ